MKLFTAALFALVPAVAYAAEWSITAYPTPFCAANTFPVLTITSNTTIGCIDWGTLSFDAILPAGCTFFAHQESGCTLSPGDAEVPGPKPEGCQTFSPVGTPYNSFSVSC